MSLPTDDVMQVYGNSGDPSLIRITSLLIFAQIIRNFSDAKCAHGFFVALFCGLALIFVWPRILFGMHDIDKTISQFSDADIKVTSNK